MDKYGDTRERLLITKKSLMRVNYALEELAENLFQFNEFGDFEDFDAIAGYTGIDSKHLYNIFHGIEPITLQDYCILSDFAEIDPINDEPPVYLDSKSLFKKYFK